MQSIIVRHSKAKRVLVTSMPIIFLLCMIGLFSISFTFFEYGSTGYNFFGDTAVLCLIPMVLSIPFIFKVHREKIVFDGYAFTVTPFIGLTRITPLREVKVCAIGHTKKIRLYDKNSNLICKYKIKNDRENVILLALRQAENCIFSFRTNFDNYVVSKGDDKIFSTYLLTGEIVSSKMSNASINNKMQIYDYERDYYKPGEIDENIRNLIDKNKTRTLIGQLIGAACVIIGVALLAEGPQGKVFSYLALILLFGGSIFCGVLEYYRRRKEFAITKSTFYRVTAIAVDEKNYSTRTGEPDRHLIYEFQDKYGVKKYRPSEMINASDIIWGNGIDEKKELWYSPYSKYLLETEPTKFRLMRKRKRLTFNVWRKRHPVLTLACAALLIWIVSQVHDIGKEKIFIYNSDGRTLQIEWAKEGRDNGEQLMDALQITGMEQEELEAWLKQSYYPFFYANNVSDEQFEAFDLKNSYYISNEYLVEKIEDNLSSYWGITDRESLIRVTNSVLKRGDKYTYVETLEQLDENSLNASEDLFCLVYQNEFPKEFCRYLGTYYAYNRIGEAGVDAWDYVRCIRLFAFGYICGYISYDEYLIHSAPIVVYLQNEYESWTQMYESYYYGHLLYVGRCGYSSTNVLCNGYSHYERMGSSVEIPFRN